MRVHAVADGGGGGGGRAEARRRHSVVAQPGSLARGRRILSEAARAAGHSAGEKNRASCS